MDRQVSKYSSLAGCLSSNYVARRRTGAIGASDRGGRRLPITRVVRMSISRSRIVRRRVIPVYAKFLGSSALIPSLIFKHCEDESLLELPAPLQSISHRIYTFARQHSLVVPS